MRFLRCAIHADQMSTWVASDSRPRCDVCARDWAGAAGRTRSFTDAIAHLRAEAARLGRSGVMYAECATFLDTVRIRDQSAAPSR